MSNGGDELALTTENIFETFKVRMTDESKLLFSTLLNNKEAMAKEQLWKAANLQKRKSRPDTDQEKDYINSRYTLDISIARLEGAGLLDVKAYGRIRTYTISSLGRDFYEYLKKN